MSEEGEAKRDGARLQSNSGRGHIQKGYAIYGDFCVDYKEYTDGFRLSRAVWAKADSDALRNKKHPALKVVLANKENTHRVRLFVVEEKLFREMKEAWEEKYEIRN